MEKTPTEKVRQGSTGRPVLYVLLAALALCLIVFAGLGLYGGSLPDQNIGGAANSGTSSEPAQLPENSSTLATPGQSTGTATPNN